MLPALAGGAVLGYLVAKNGGKQLVLVPSEHSLVSTIEELKTKKLKFSGVKTIALDTARTGIEKEAIDIVGDFLSVESIDGTGVQIIFSEPENARHSLNNNREFTTPFYRIFLIHTAQAGKTVVINYGRDAAFQAVPLVPVKIANTIGTEINPAIKEAFVPLEVASQHGVAELVDTDILATDITPTNTPCLFRIMTMLETSGVFSCMLKSGGVTKKLKLNSGTALTADCAYLFDVLVHSGDTVNFQTNTAGNVTLRVQEIVGGVQ